MKKGSELSGWVMICKALSKHTLRVIGNPEIACESEHKCLEDIEQETGKERIMYGKHFESLYEGSMIGSGAMVFAVWGYVIAKQKPDSKVGMQVRLNPKLLGPILGEPVDEVQKAIEYLCEPDEHSTSKVEGGRRLVRIGEFDYRVVNGAKYHAIRNEEERKEQNRAAQERFRDKKKKDKGPLGGEQTFEKRMGDGASEAELDNLTDRVGIKE